MLFLDKDRISKQFSRHSGSYDEFASLQKQLAKELSETVKKLGISPNNILDIGTGTGELAFLLHDLYKDAAISGCDIAPGMITKACQKNRSENISFTVCDAESLPYHNSEFDLVVSSTTYQWVEDLNKAFCEANRTLKKNGHFILTTFGPDSLSELKKAYKLIVDEKAEYLHEYRTVSEVGSILEDCGFKVLNLSSRSVRTIYTDFRDMQRTIKNIGAMNASTNLPKGLRSKVKVKALIDHYENAYRVDHHIYATYEIIEAICQK